MDLGSNPAFSQSLCCFFLFFCGVGGGGWLSVGECSFLQLIKQKSEIAKVSLREKSIIYSLAFSTKFALILLQTSV